MGPAAQAPQTEHFKPRVSVRLAYARAARSAMQRDPSTSVGPPSSVAQNFVLLRKLLCFCVNCSKAVPETVVFLCKLCSPLN